jgi:hypothetical protein
VLCSEWDARELAVEPLLGPSKDEPENQNQEYEARDDRKTILLPPSHAGESMGRDDHLSKRFRGRDRTNPGRIRERSIDGTSEFCSRWLVW